MLALVVLAGTTAVMGLVEGTWVTSDAVVTVLEYAIGILVAGVLLVLSVLGWRYIHRKLWPGAHDEWFV